MSISAAVPDGAPHSHTSSSYDWQYKSNKAARDEASIFPVFWDENDTFPVSGRGFSAFSRHAPSVSAQRALLETKLDILRNSFIHIWLGG